MATANRRIRFIISTGLLNGGPLMCAPAAMQNARPYKAGVFGVSDGIVPRRLFDQRAQSFGIVLPLCDGLTRHARFNGGTGYGGRYGAEQARI